MDGLCECGCGRKTNLTPDNNATEGYVRGKPKRFITGHNRWTKPDKYEVDPDTGCWIWLLSTTLGYGVTWTGKRTIQAHRYYYQQKYGALNSATILHHVCGNRRCCNPDHLMPMTRTEHVHLHNLMKKGVV